MRVKSWVRVRVNAIFNYVKTKKVMVRTSFAEKKQKKWKKKSD
jgi:hypothetical protein